MVSNKGMYDVENFAEIINPPEALLGAPGAGGREWRDPDWLAALRESDRLCRSPRQRWSRGGTVYAETGRVFGKSGEDVGVKYMTHPKLKDSATDYTDQHGF